MIWDRLGVITDEVSQHLGEALDWAAANGLKHVEIRMIGGRNVMELSDEEADGVRRETEARGMFVSCLASPVFKCSLDPARPAAAGDTFGQEEQSVQAHFTKLERAIGIAKLLGTHRIRIFSFWREAKPTLHRAEIVSKLKAAAEAAEREQIVLLLENEPACNGGYADEVAGLVRAVDSVYMKVLWDPGNEVYGGRFAYPDGYREVKDVLDHVHLKDAVIREGGAPGCVPIGRGDVPIGEQIRALEADGYQGLYTLETHYIPEGGTAKDGTAMTLEGLRAVLK